MKLSVQNREIIWQENCSLLIHNNDVTRFFQRFRWSRIFQVFYTEKNVFRILSWIEVIISHVETLFKDLIGTLLLLSFKMLTLLSRSWKKVYNSTFQLLGMGSVYQLGQSPFKFALIHSSLIYLKIGRVQNTDYLLYTLDFDIR